MNSKKRKVVPLKTKADLEMISRTENLLIEKEKRFQTELKKSRRPQVEKLTMLKKTKMKAVPKVNTKSKSKK